MINAIKVVGCLLWVIFGMFLVDLSLGYIRAPSTIWNIIGLAILIQLGIFTYLLTLVIFKNNEKSN